MNTNEVAPQHSLEGKCSNCRYFKHKNPEECGWCRRNAPIGSFRWPEVNADDWCGEFEQKPISSLPENVKAFPVGPEKGPEDVVRDIRLENKDVGSGTIPSQSNGVSSGEHVSLYGFCPICNYHIVSRERRIDGNDMCRNGHKFPSKDAIPLGR